MFGEALKTNEKESYDSKIEISDIGIPDTPPPPPPPPCGGLHINPPSKVLWAQKVMIKIMKISK